MNMTTSIAGTRGSALILTILVITTLTGLAVAFSRDSGMELSLAGYARDGFRAYEVARSAVHLAMSVLINEDDEEMKKLREEWSKPGIHTFPDRLAEELSVSGQIVDESGKLNVNLLVDENGEVDEERCRQLTRLFQALGLDESLTVSLLDWLDSDDIARMDGAEAHYYQNLPEPYACGNGPFLTPGQIFMVKGYNDLERFGEKGNKTLLDYLTIYSDGKVNINTAGREVLQTLSANLDSTIADAIIEYRKEEEFLTVDDLRNVVGIDGVLFNEIKDGITVKGSSFAIEVRGQCADAVAIVRAVVSREDGNLKMIYFQVM